MNCIIFRQPGGDSRVRNRKIGVRPVQEFTEGLQFFAKIFPFSTNLLQDSIVEV